MPIRVLGCSGAIADQCRTTSFLVNDHLLVDAGTGVGDLSVPEMARIDHILLTHSHLDHVAALPLLADSVMRVRGAQGLPPICVMALPQTLAALREHIFNDIIWPDFTRLPTHSQPVLSMQPLQVGQRLQLGAVTAEVLPAWHTVPAVGYALWADDPQTSACWVFTGDTGPNPDLWARLSRLKVQQLVIETAFSDADAELAHTSRHLHPQQLAAELRTWSHAGDVYVTHIKPGEELAIMSAIQDQELPHRVRLLRSGDVMPLGAKAAVPA
jgi:ribonuclease BN (tRNA processing enzyme)